MNQASYKSPAVKLLERLIQWDALDIVGSDGPFWKSEIQQALDAGLTTSDPLLPAEIQEQMVIALAMYADPGFYHGCGFAFDRPTGGFDQDFAITDGYDRPMPGDYARTVLTEAGVIMNANPETSEEFDDEEITPQINAGFKRWCNRHGMSTTPWLKNNPEAGFDNPRVQDMWRGFMAGATWVKQDLIPKNPSPGLLMSMAVRYDHGLGCPGFYDSSFPGEVKISHQMRVDSALRTMRQLYEEVSGYGFYNRDRDAAYVALIPSKGGDS
jgi:hypothetical protein